MNWFAENAGTIVIALVLAAVVAAVIFCQIRAKRSGKTTCGSGCSSCPSAGCCARQAKAASTSRKHPF